MANIFDLFKKIEKTETSTAPVSCIIAGLGNPGARYERTRHNIGFVAVDAVAQALGVRIDRSRFHALCTEARCGESRVLLMKPETFMNLSGTAIAEAARFYKIPPERVIVLHDEISFAPGMMRIRRRGSAGGHNGLKSIIECLGSEAFPRIKIGVGAKPSPDYDLADWVLGKLTDDGMQAIGARMDDIVSAVRLMVDGRIDDAMSRFSK